MIWLLNMMEILLLYLLIHYYNLLMPIMFDEVQVHSFDFEWNDSFQLQGRKNWKKCVA
jgi:hypothetical protein